MIVLAFDGDEAGQHAVHEAFLNALEISDSEKNFLRAYSINGGEFADCVGLLDNYELSQELATWTKAKAASGAPDWWYEMCEDHRTACLQEITKRSKQTNDQTGGGSFIKAFNDNNTISGVLMANGYKGIPGRSVRCPMHDDSTPSLSISRDDGRGYCFNQSCILWHDGYGVDAYELNKILSGR